MKKVIILILFVILISGCSAEYNLIIKNDSLEESFTSVIYKSEIPQPNPLYPDIPVDDPLTPFIEQDQYPFSDNHDIVYDKKIIEEDDYRKVNYKYTYSKKEFANSYVINLCFDEANYSYDNNYKFDLKGPFYCLRNDELFINITTKNKVLKHNADKVKGNTYTWVVNRSNVEDFSINMEISRRDMVKSLSRHPLLVVLFITGVVLVVVILLVLIRNKKSNKI